MLARIHRKLCTTLAELLSEARKDPCFDQRRRFAALRRMSPACRPPPPQIGKRTKGRQACETSCATSCLTARRTCTSVMGIVAGQPMTRLTPMTRPLRRRIYPVHPHAAWTRLSASTCQSEDLLTEREVCPLKCQNDLHAKAKSSQGSKFPGYPRSKDTRACSMRARSTSRPP